MGLIIKQAIKQHSISCYHIFFWILIFSALERELHSLRSDNTGSSEEESETIPTQSETELS